MAEVNSGPDSLQMYLTGADATDGVQLDAALSLGGYRSIARAEPLLIHRFAPLQHTVLEYAAGRNGAGLGVLEAVGTDSLRWTAPAGTPGAAVEIANGERKVLVDGANPSAYVIVRRVSPYELGGREVVQLLPYLHNVAGMGDFAADDAQGKSLYRAVMLRNASDQPVTNVKVWADLSNIYYSYLKYRGETPDANGALTIIADEKTGPGGRFAQGTKEATATVIAATLNPGEQIGLWLSKEQWYVSMEEYARAVFTSRWCYKWTVGGVTYYGEIAGANRIPRSTTPRYLIWLGAGSPPNSEAFYLDKATNTLPYTYPLNLPGPQTYYIHVREQNKYGLRSPVQEIVLHVDAQNDMPADPPCGPAEVTLEARPDGKVLIWALYNPREEGDTPAAIAAARADEWVVYVKAGEAPDPDVDTSTATQAMRGGEAREVLAYTTVSGYVEGTPIYVLVRTRRNDGTAEDPVWMESLNTDAKSVHAQWWGPRRPRGAISFGQTLGVTQSPVTAPDAQVVVDVDKGVYWEVTSRGTRLYADGALVWNLRYDGPSLPGNGLYTTLDFHEGTVSGAAAALVEFGTWDESAKEIYVAAGGVRLLKIDLVARTIICGGLTQVTAPVGSLSDAPVWERYEETDFQCWSASEEEYVTGMALAAAGLRLAVDWKQRATETECL